MCGIYGTTIPYNTSQVKEKLARTSFRGPDRLKAVVFDDGKVTFGHNRLSIIDLDHRSDQPFVYEHLTIAYNGEIFNFKALRQQLEKEGFKFSTTSDTEVVCAAYLKFGSDCVQHFNGMFAFVIHDGKTNTFFGARDRLGQKPFYYYQKGRDFEFASQLSSIQLHHNDLSISNKAILEYLRWGAIPEPLSIFNEIKKLKPGFCFLFDLKEGAYKEWQYWDLNLNQQGTYVGNYENAVEELELLLHDAVKLRMYADVPLGVFLSGGIDSSLIAAIATKTVDRKVNTFSVKFNEKGFDESVYAQKVADHINTNHHVIECNHNEGLDLIGRFNHFYDEPFADASAIPSMLLAKHTRKHVTVALSGDAGDESFLGYHRYKWMKQVDPLFKMPAFVRKTIAGACGLAPNYRIKTIGKGLGFDSLEELYTTTITSMDLNWIDHKWNAGEFEENKYLHGAGTMVERASNFDVKAYLNWHINTKVDRATMAFSLEARSPLMDYRIVEFAKSLPTNFKYDGNEQKKILKSLLYKHVPKALFDRPKAGFTMPFEKWFRNELKEMVLSELSPRELKNLPGVNAPIVSSMIDQHMNGSWNRYPVIWKVLVLKQWLTKNSMGLSIQ
jgi:asparagine synthase (glutamine-hydrolysing)